MRAFQFSLWSLLVATGLLAVFCVAILNAGTVATAVSFWITLLSIPFGVVAVVYQRDSKRAFWLGYVLGSCLYALVILYAIGVDPQNITREALADHALISGQTAAWVFAVLPESRRPPLTTGFRGISYAAEVPRSFRYQFHFAFIVLSGWLCGMAAIWLCRTQPKDK
jgi:hypothetical protein